MTVTCEMFNAEKHYEDVSGWWRMSDWPVIPLSHLPKVGFVVSVDGILACCGWVYRTDSAFAWFEFVVANPDVRREPRFAALNELIDQVKHAAKVMGAKSIFMSAHNQSLISRLESRGFVVADKGMTNLMFNIEGE